MYPYVYTAHLVLITKFPRNRLSTSWSIWSIWSRSWSIWSIWFIWSVWIRWWSIWSIWSRSWSILSIWFTWSIWIRSWSIWSRSETFVSPRHASRATKWYVYFGDQGRTSLMRYFSVSIEFAFLTSSALKNLEEIGNDPRHSLFRLLSALSQHCYDDRVTIASVLMRYPILRAQGGIPTSADRRSAHHDKFRRTRWNVATPRFTTLGVSQVGGGAWFPI